MKDLLKGKTFGEWTVVSTYSCRCGTGVIKPRAVVKCKNGHVSTVLQSALFNGNKDTCKPCGYETIEGKNYFAASRYKFALKSVGKIYDSWKIISVEEVEIKYCQRMCKVSCVFCGDIKETRLRNITRTQFAKCKTCKLRKRERENGQDRSETNG